MEADEPALGKHLIERIRSTLIFFEDTHDVEIDEIFISGQSAKDDDLIDEIRSAMGVPCDTIPLPPEVDSKWGLAYALGQKGCGNSHGREFDLRAEQFAYQGNIQRIATALQYLAVLVLDWIYWLCWLVLDRALINQQRNRLSRRRFVTQIKETMPDLPNL